MRDVLPRLLFFWKLSRSHLFPGTMTDSYYVDSFLKEVHQAIQALKIKESESTWKSLDSTFHKLTGCVAALPPTCPSEQLSCIFPVLKELVSPINQFILSERTKLSGSALEFLRACAMKMGHSFETMLDAFLPTLVKCCAKANKVFVLRGSACLVDIMRHCRPVKLLPKFVDHLGNASKSARIAVASSFLALLEVFQEGNFTKDAPTQDANGEHPKLPFPHVLKDHVNDIKNILNLALCDAAPEVRHAASRSFILFQKYFPEQANLFVENASLQILKVLKITTLAVKGPSLDVAESTLRRPVRPVGAASIRGSTKEEHCLPLSLNTSSCGIVGEASKENVTLKDHNSLSLSGSISSLNSKPMRAPTPEAKIFPCGASKPSISTGTKTSITKISSSSTKPLSSVPTKMWSSNARIPDMKSFGVASPNPNMITNNLYSSTPKSVLGSASRIMKPSTEHASIRKNIFGAPSKPVDLKIDSVDLNTEDTIIKINVEETTVSMNFEETRNTSSNQEITHTDVFLTTEK